MIERPQIAFVGTPNYSARQGLEQRARLIVLHSAECGETPEAAENLASWGQGKNRPRASWHFAVDNNSITQSVRVEHRAWHAKEVNDYSIGIEQAGRASQTRAQWFDEYSKAMLDRCARLVAWLCHEYTIPVEFVTAGAIAAEHPNGGAWGITTHAEISKAFETAGGHWDPGPEYPIGWMIQRIDDLLLQNGVKK